jgi:hypothetical protein
MYGINIEINAFYNVDIINIVPTMMIVKLFRNKVGIGGWVAKLVRDGWLSWRGIGGGRWLS